MTREELDSRLAVIRTVEWDHTDAELGRMAARIVIGLVDEGGADAPTLVRQLVRTVLHHRVGSLRSDLTRSEVAVLEACTDWMYNGMSPLCRLCRY